MKRHRLITAIVSGSLLISSAAILAPSYAKEKEATNRKERAEDGKMTNADRARVALDHLKKAQTELENVTNDKKDGPAGDALGEVKNAIVAIDKYIEEVDKAKK